MKFSVATAAIALAASSSAATVAKPFTLSAVQTNSNGLLDKPIHAHDGQLWVNRATASSCPSSVKSCPKGTTTAFRTADGLTAMNADVPGGQQLYIGPKGVVRFTSAHSGAVPAGSTTEGTRKILLSDRVWLCNEPKSSGDAAKRYYLTVAKNATALPAQAAAGGTCTKAKLRASELKDSAASAWQYN